MNNIKIFILTLWIVSCGRKAKTVDNEPPVEETAFKTEKTENVQNFSITLAKPSDFERAKSNFIQKMLFDTLSFQKVKGLTHLPTDNGNVIFKDIDKDSIDDKIEIYNYEGQLNKVGYYVVRGDFYESTNYYLINKHTSKQTEIWNKPFLSPSDNFIATLSMDTREEISRGIQIWKINKHQNNKIDKYIELEQYKWVPDTMFWETEKTIILKVTDIDKYMTIDNLQETDFYYLRMKIN